MDNLKVLTVDGEVEDKRQIRVSRPKPQEEEIFTLEYIETRLNTISAQIEKLGVEQTELQGLADEINVAVSNVALKQKEEIK